MKMNVPPGSFTRVMVLYNVLVSFLTAVFLPFILVYLAFSSKRRSSFLQKTCISSPNLSRHSGKDTEGTRIWVHALSVGEVLSAVPLLKEMKRVNPDCCIFLSVSTLTGFNIARKHLGDDNKLVEALFFSPFDLFFSVRRMFHAVSPDRLVIVEGDLWPNFLYHAHLRQIPVFLVNARMSERSCRGFKRMSFIMLPMLSIFSKIFVQADLYSSRYEKLGLPGDKIFSLGNIKFDQDGTAITDDELSAMRKKLLIDDTSRVLVAGSTHEGEEEVLAEALRKLRKIHESLIMVVAPRDPLRSAHVVDIFRRNGFTSSSLKSLCDLSPGSSPQVVVIDVIGMLRKLYAIADLTFVGGSLTRDGGHNPLEPAVYAKPVMFGPHMTDFSEISRELTCAGGGCIVNDALEIAEVSGNILSSRDMAMDMGLKGRGVFDKNRGAIVRVVKNIFDDKDPSGNEEF